VRPSLAAASAMSVHATHRVHMYFLFLFMLCRFQTWSWPVRVGDLKRYENKAIPATQQLKRRLFDISQAHDMWWCGSTLGAQPWRQLQDSDDFKHLVQYKTNDDDVQQKKDLGELKRFKCMLSQCMSYLDEVGLPAMESKDREAIEEAALYNDSAQLSLLRPRLFEAAVGVAIRDLKPDPQRIHNLKVEKLSTLYTLLTRLRKREREQAPEEEDE
jgi:hypothetical protein